MAAKCMSRKAAKIVFWVSAAILVVSVTILLIFPTIYKNQLKSEIALTDGSLLTGIWKDIPLPLYEKLYFFNITNGEDFLERGAPLNITEIGPYTYSARWVKRFPEWHSNGTVSYRETRTYHFEEHLSIGSEDDVITTLNGPFIIAAEILKKYNIIERLIAAGVLGLAGEHIIIQKSVKELAYEGYPDPIMKVARYIMSDIPYQDGRFSWLYGKNATNDGLFTVFTGENDPQLTNIINKWNGLDKVNFWKNGSSCNLIKGTSIETGPPLPEVPESYTFFQSIFCRSLTLNYTEDVSHFGVVTKRFKPTKDIFANGTENPANSCFDIKERPSGVSDIKKCQFGAPALISWPHFYMGDPSYLKDIDGLNPNEEDHGSHLDVDPVTGISLDIQLRFQINLELSRVRGLVQFDDVPEGIFPVLWVGLEIHVTDDWAHFLKGQLKNPKIIAYSVLGCLVLISLILIVVALLVLRRTADEEDDPLLDIKEEHKQNLSKKVIVPNYDSSGSYKEGISGTGHGRASKEAEAANSGSMNSGSVNGAYEEEDVTVVPVDPSAVKKS